MPGAQTWMAGPSPAMTVGHEPDPKVIRLFRTGPLADLLLIAGKARCERLGGNITYRKAVIRETARRSSIPPDHQPRPT